MIIAIDGPAAAGKGTLARRLAAALGFAYLDTGLIYRAVAAKLLAAGLDPAAEQAATRIAQRLTLKDLERPDLRDERVSRAASRVAAIPRVRGALLDLQRRFAASPPGGQAGAVLDGRDIGTVVCPEAEVKLFVTASPEARAGRRHKELIDRGKARIYPRVMQDMQERDSRDSERNDAPLRPAKDAIVLDTSDMDPDAVFQAALDIIAPQRPADPV
ncbi:MAG: (d)CMP kinase [Kiloniellaceae bacterium]